MTASGTTTVHTMTRLDIATTIPFDDFLGASNGRRRSSTPPPSTPSPTAAAPGTRCAPRWPPTPPTD